MALTFAEAAPALADLMEGGVSASDPRVMALCNEGMQALAAEGVWVGSMGEAIICTSAVDKTFTLPRELEVAVEVTQIFASPETLAPGVTDVSNGWYEITNPSTFMDPDFWMDDILVDRGEFCSFADPCSGVYIRAYTMVPEASGKKFFYQGFNGPQPVFTNSGSAYIEGEEIPLPVTVGAGTGAEVVTKLNRMRKDKTAGYVRVYAVPIDGTTPQYQIAFMHPDETEARYRRYYFPEMYLTTADDEVNDQPVAQLRVTGIRRFIPVTKPTDLLLIPNLQALKLMIKSILKSRNNAPQDAEAYKQQAVNSLMAEVKRYQLDPRQTLIRRAQYEQDLKDFTLFQHGHVLAQIALEVPFATKIGKRKLGRLINEAERNLMESGKWKGLVTQITMPDPVSPGLFTCPPGVEVVLDGAINSTPLRIYDQSFVFGENGPGLPDANGYGPEAMYDRGYDADGNRTYFITSRLSDPFTLDLRVKLRHTQKGAADIMQLRNYSAVKDEVRSLIEAGMAPPIPANLPNAKYWRDQAQAILDAEIIESTAGVPPRPRIQQSSWALSSINALR